MFTFSQANVQGYFTVKIKEISNDIVGLHIVSFEISVRAVRYVCWNFNNSQKKGFVK